MRKRVFMLTGIFILFLSMVSGTASAQETTIYTVQYGDTLESIAGQYPGVTAEEIAVANDIPQWGYIWVGQDLVIPQLEAEEERIADVVYTTQAGDTLGAIAARFGVERADIVAANNLADPNRIGIDQTLVIPGVRLDITGVEPVALGRGGGIAQTYVVRGGETLADIAARFGISESALIDANGITDPNQVNYIRQLIIPEVDQGGYIGPEYDQEAAFRYTVQSGETLSEIAARFGVDAADIASANGLTDLNHVEFAQTLLIPGAVAGLEEGQGGFTDITVVPPPATGGPVGAAPAAEAIVQPVSPPATYTVRTGDTLAGIAARFGTTTAALAAANGISNPSYIQIGQVLMVPGMGGAVYTAPAYYTVRTGDTLAGITARFGTTTAALAAANGISNPSYIQIGQVLAIPSGDQAG